MTEAEPLPAPIDLEDLRARASGDRAFALELLHLFSKDLQVRLTRMTTALDARDARRIETDAHALRGASASLGADFLCHLAGQLESASRGQLADETPTLLQNIRNEFSRLLSYLDSQGWKLPDPPPAETAPGPPGPEKDLR